jgi:hypothetical protein
MVTDAPCQPWATVEDATACNGCGEYPLGALEDALTVASGWLWRITGRIYGSCPATVRPLGADDCIPCDRVGWYFDRSRNCWTPPYDARYAPGRREGAHEIRLGYANVTEIIDVCIDGIALPPTSYRLDDGRWLVRCDGDTWRTGTICAEPATLEVHLVHGIPVPPDGVRAAATLACEVARACAGDKECRLPRRVQSISRQGVTMMVLDPLDVLDQGRFGIPEVDYFVRSVNPNNLDRRAVVASPDVGRAVRITT